MQVPRNPARLGKPKVKATDPKPEPLLVRPEQAAKMCAIGRNAIYRLLADGSIRTIKLGRSRLIPVSELQAWVQRQLEEDVGGGAA